MQMTSDYASNCLDLHKIYTELHSYLLNLAFHIWAAVKNVYAPDQLDKWPITLTTKYPFLRVVVLNQFAAIY